VLALLALLSAPAQTPAAPTTIPVEAEIVHVEALVTDKKGRPVPGLTAADFTVFEDGRAVPIVAFEAPLPFAGPSDTPAPGERAVAPPRSSSPPPDAPTIVVYLDNRNLTPGGRLRVLDGLLPFLEAQLADGRTRVLVLAELRGTRAMGGVTSDPGAVRSALEEAAREAPQGVPARSDERATVDLLKTAVEAAELMGIPCDQALPELESIVRQHAEARIVHLRETFARLAGVANALGALPGTKALLYLSENLEQVPALPLFEMIGDFCPPALQSHASELFSAAQPFDLSRSLQELAARANAARVTLYPIDGAGLTAPSSSDVSFADRRFTPTARNDFVRRVNLKAGPGILADQTGGLSVFDSNRPALALKSFSDELYGRYALGFSPARAADGRSHSLRVEVARKGLSVRHRLSYLHAPAAEAQVDRTWAALLVGYEDDGLGARITAESSGEAGAAGVSIHIVVPLDRLGTRPEADARVGQLRVVMAMRAAGAGGVTEASAVGRENTMELRLPPMPPGGDAPGATHELFVRMPVVVGDYEIAVGVRDLIGGRASYKRVPVRALSTTSGR
jgi:VWFA-related protein